MILDATKKDIHKALLEAELEAVGIRLNCAKPSIYYKQKKAGGVKFTATCTLTKCDGKMVQRILQEYKIFNAEVLFREDASPEQFIDVIMGNCIYIPCLYVYNKIDQIPLVSKISMFMEHKENFCNLVHNPNDTIFKNTLQEEVDRLAREEHNVVIR